MKRIYGIFAAVLCLAAGCAKEIVPSGNELVTELTAGVAPTKTVLDGSKVYWTSGDQINVNGVTSDELAIDAPSATATFTFKGVLNTPYKAVFPASIYKDENTVTMPSACVSVPNPNTPAAAPQNAKAFAPKPPRVF